MDNVQIEATLEANPEGVKGSLGSIRGVCRVSVEVQVHGTEDLAPVQDTTHKVRTRLVVPCVRCQGR